MFYLSSFFCCWYSVSKGNHKRTCESVRYVIEVKLWNLRIYKTPIITRDVISRIIRVHIRTVKTCVKYLIRRSSIVYIKSRNSIRLVSSCICPISWNIVTSSLSKLIRTFTSDFLYRNMVNLSYLCSVFRPYDIKSKCSL